MPQTTKDLAMLFETLGAPDPQGWAQSEAEEGIPQLHRFLFLRQAWKKVVSETDTDWPNRTANLEEADSEVPFAGVSHALSGLLAKGATSEEIIDLVRGVQAQFLLDICYLLEDPNLEEDDVEDVSWGLYKLDDEDQPVSAVSDLHESALEMDPTGREMMPRGTEL
ncbi:MAG: hypothetical protein ABJ327_05565 [Litoreibacter sp.]